MFANKKLIATFASLVPAKPLHNAQIGGAFYFITLMAAFTKGYLPKISSSILRTPILILMLLHG